MSGTLTVDGLVFEVRRSARRKTVGITIERDGKLVLSAPDGCSTEVVERVARAKRFWIHTKLAEKDLLLQPGVAKEYVSGEGFYYLGRNYRLLLVDAPAAGEERPLLRLDGGRFLLRRDARLRGRQHFVAWYTKHARPWLMRRVELLQNRVGAVPREVEVRDLGYRWGSCGGGDALNFHWRTILLPPRVCQYIVVHELVHLREPSHTPEFWQRLEAVMPDFATRKQWLAENGAHFSI